MREAHAHLAAYGQSIAMPSLADCRSPAEALDLIARCASALVSGPRPAWLRLHSARIEAWNPPAWPTLADLDRAARNASGDPIPCVVMSFDHHAAVANTAALFAAGLTPSTPLPPGGVVCTDESTGRPTGLLLEHAAFRVWEAAPEPTPDERRAHVALACRALADLGFTEAHDLHAQPWLGPILADLERSGQLPLDRIRLYPPIRDLAAIHAGRADWESTRIRLAGGKLFADGTLNSRTALMLAPYRDPLLGAPRGRAMLSPADLDSAIQLTESLDLHLTVHAIGDGAIRMVLDAIERTARAPRNPGNRHRIEHCELIDPADIPRFASLGVVCSVQPCHLLADIEVLRRQLPHRLDRVLPLRDLIDAGCRPGGDDSLLWFGSDVPIVRADPGDSILAAVHRRRADMPEAEAIAPAQRITEPEARAAFAC